MNILLSSKTSEIVIPIVIMSIVLVVSILIVVFLKRKFGADKGMITKNEPRKVEVELKHHYMKQNEVTFLKNLYKILPAELIAFPKVGVDNLVKPISDKVLYNTILSQYVDVCVFQKSDMKPILAIDLFEPSPIEQQLKQMHPNVLKALNTVGIPILQYQLSEEYDLMELKAKIIDAMPSKMIALLKKKALED